jgi:UDP-N-acetylmuramoyl-L-alanyl-D-glutamate--2,6-diaminopimelate ligase
MNRTHPTLARPRSAAGGPEFPGLETIEITGITADSRAVQPGFIFAALPGGKVSGVDFIPEAKRRGAAGIIAPVGTRAETDLPVIEDALPRKLFAQMAAAFYGAQPEIVVAVTGTSGKSSTVSFARQLWTALGQSAASLGTLGIESDPITRYGTLTTADPVELHADLAALAHAGVTRAAMEASSHGLDQYRLDGVRVRAAGFTSFGRDHLDYHATTDSYLAAKIRLFAEVLQPGGVAVLNADIPEYRAAARRRRGRGPSRLVLWLAGARPENPQAYADPDRAERHAKPVRRRIRHRLPAGRRIPADERAVRVGDGDRRRKSPTSRAVAPARFVDRGLEALTGVRGRLECVATLPNGATVYVDYAHKPDALVAVLKRIAPAYDGKLIVAFGCGGDRDPGKRPIMGEIATKLADRVIVTDDNPRTEMPAAIRAAIMAGAPGAIEIGDRAEAIAAGIRKLQAGDIFVVAGKGHEQGQIVGETVLPVRRRRCRPRRVAEVRLSAHDRAMDRGEARATGGTVPPMREHGPRAACRSIRGRWRPATCSSR